ncbi:hypothetical protein K449DRAFT_419170 [Hypoxylon sp. EC38]|nr:hypothetical protein K449DRAFT_419170 [Hypoxylon sp. EC38]
MIEQVHAIFAALLQHDSWLAELAGILPLSALIDFIDVPGILHIFELTGAIPLWCWAVTPSGGRLLLSKTNVSESCFLDRFGNSPSLICLDGRYGDSYPMASPETVRLCLSSIKGTYIPNDHVNMNRDDKRLQKLEVIHVSRVSHPKKQRWPQGYGAASVFGWVLLLGILVFGCMMKFWWMVAFYLIVPLTGVLIYMLHGSKPRKLGAKADGGSDFNRLVLVARHMNEVDWQVFYGESAVVNSLLNWPLQVDPILKKGQPGLRLALRVLIFSQWVIAIGAAATKGWDAYGITFWVWFCILSHNYVFSPERSTSSWLRHFAEIRMERFQTHLSSRRALLNAVVALNPDTFEMDLRTREDKVSQLYSGSLLLIDPILKAGPDRTRWEEATRLAMVEARLKRRENIDSGSKKDDKSPTVVEEEDWKATYGDRYWCRYISEGIEVAENISQRADLTGRFVRKPTGKVGMCH